MDKEEERKAKRRQYQKEYQRRWIEDRKQKGLEILGGKCVKCGSTERLEFDHVDPKIKNEKIRHGGSLFSLKWEDVLEELKRCQLLCRPCHIEKTINNRDNLRNFNRFKLNENIVREIRRKWASGEKNKAQIARDLNIHVDCVKNVVRGRSWKHIV